ncbi:MAG: lipopolysaccharide/colanic/teichoic acid biosynthesis glycosyltransferase [bacterium]|jgi:lipopolysaccharide/colanic/teichoic acid biosynthesis glycosyltransferase
MMYYKLKKTFDVLSSGIAILILSPILIPVIIGLKLTGEGYIFYKQERVGYKNKTFLIWKFATMLKDSPNMPGGIMTTKKDPRITPMGGFLRSSKINELPQLFNIFFGRMSVVGPRPVMKISFEAYPNEIQKVIYNVKPGLTGIGSIIFRDEEELISEVKNNGGDVWEFYKGEIYPFKGELEIWYQNNKSFMLDIKLIFLTVWVILVPTSKIYKKWFKDLPKRNF